MDAPVVITTLVLAASAVYRTMSGKNDTLTAGLWTAMLATGIAFFCIPIDDALQSVTGFSRLGQLLISLAFVASSYLVAKKVYYVARIDSLWPLIFTGASITGMLAVYGATDLHSQHSSWTAGSGWAEISPISEWLDLSPGAASTWFAVAFALGVFPTHIAAIIGVLEVRQPDNPPRVRRPIELQVIRCTYIR